MLPHHYRFLNTMGLCRILHNAHMFCLIHPAEIITFRLDKSPTTTTLPPPVPRSTRSLRRNFATLVKKNLFSSITIRHPHHQIGCGDINNIIAQLSVDLLTPHLQHLPTNSHLRRTSSSRRPLIIVTNNQKNTTSAPGFSGMQINHPTQKTNYTIITA